MVTVDYIPQVIPADVECMLTTVDNDYDPFTQFDEWKTFDEQVLGYCTCGLIDRYALTSNELSDEENDKEIKRAFVSILNQFPGLYRVVTRSN